MVSVIGGPRGCPRSDSSGDASRRTLSERRGTRVTRRRGRRERAVHSARGSARGHRPRSRAVHSARGSARGHRPRSRLAARSGGGGGDGGGSGDGDGSGGGRIGRGERGVGHRVGRRVELGRTHRHRIGRPVSRGQLPIAGHARRRRRVAARIEARKGCEHRARRSELQLARRRARRQVVQKPRVLRNVLERAACERS